MKVFTKESSTLGIKTIFALPKGGHEIPYGYIEISGLSADFPILKLKNRIIGCKKIDEMEMRTDYDVGITPDSSVIKITGNLFNAFSMLEERGILGDEITQTLKADEEFINCLDLMKFACQEKPQSRYQLPENQKYTGSFYQVHTVTIAIIIDGEQRLSKTCSLNRLPNQGELQKIVADFSQQVYGEHDLDAEQPPLTVEPQ